MTRGALLTGALALAALTAAPASGRVRPLLSLSPGNVLVSLGPASEWLPVGGSPTDLTLRAGRPAAAHPLRLNAYVAFRQPSRSCPASAPGHTLTINHLYAPANFTEHHYEVTLPNVDVRQRGSTLACVWLGPRRRHSRLAAGQIIPLLNGLFAASVSALGPDSAYTLEAMRVSRAFRYRASSTVCGRTYRDPVRTIAADEVGVEAVSYGADSCIGDGSRFTFTTIGARPLGALTYTVRQPAISALGGCELDPVTGAALSQAEAYVRADGCSVKQTLAARFRAGTRRHSVVEALVDGGVAEIAPRGTAVDLVVNGR